MNDIDTLIDALDEAMRAGTLPEDAHDTYQALIHALFSLELEERAPAVRALCGWLERCSELYFGETSVILGIFLERGWDAPRVAEVTWSRGRPILIEHAALLASQPAEQREAFFTMALPGELRRMLDAVATALLTSLFHTRRLLAEARADDAFTAAIDTLEPVLPQAHWLGVGLSMVFQEPVIVLDMTHGRGWRGHVDGVVSNFQLHALLLHALATQVDNDFTLEPLDDEALAYYTRFDENHSTPAVHSDLGLFTAGGVRAVHRVDAEMRFLHQIWNEGSPGDIPRVDGHLVILVTQPDIQRSWRAPGAPFPQLDASFTLEGELDEPARLRWIEALEGRAVLSGEASVAGD